MYAKKLHGKIPLIAGLFLFFLAAAPLMEAQSPSPASGSNQKQRLSWKASEYSFRYEVIIEKEESGSFTALLREFTVNRFIDVSLEPGRYRYRVIPYDFFNESGESSRWVSFEVRSALRPELFAVEPDHIQFESSDAGQKEVTLNLYGRNLERSAGIYLHGPNEIEFPSGAVYIFNSGRNGRLKLSLDLLESGTYSILIRNPGGYETAGGNISVVRIEPPPPELAAVSAPVEPPEEPAPAETPESEEAVPEEPILVEAPESEVTFKEALAKLLASADFFAAAGWMPLLPVYGDGKEFFGRSFLFPGAVLRLAISGAKPAFLNPGVELAVSWFNHNGNSGAENHFISMQVNFVVRKWTSNNRAALTFRAGIDACLFNNSVAGHINVNTGVSFLLLLTPHFYLETGIDHTHIFTEKASGCLRPWLGLGVKT